MNWKKVVAGIALVDFVALNIWALYATGISGLGEYVASMDNPWDLVLAADLVIALTIVATGIFVDARKRGKNGLAYSLLTLLTGSISPLLYLVTRREETAGA